MVKWDFRLIIYTSESLSWKIPTISLTAGLYLAWVVLDVVLVSVAVTVVVVVVVVVPDLANRAPLSNNCRWGVWRYRMVG